MTRMEAGACVICGSPATSKWTLNDGREAAIAELCGTHADPLREVMNASVIDAPRDEVRERRMRGEPLRRGGRERLQPFDWKPPASR